MVSLFPTVPEDKTRVPTTVHEYSRLLSRPRLRITPESGKLKGETRFEMYILTRICRLSWKTPNYWRICPNRRHVFLFVRVTIVDEKDTLPSKDLNFVCSGSTWSSLKEMDKTDIMIAMKTRYVYNINPSPSVVVGLPFTKDGRYTFSNK